MARINIEDIKQELAQENWKVISKEYANLSTEMEFECPEGHKVFSTWEKMRKRRECPVCKQNGLKINKPVIVEKKKGTYRTLSLDQASRKTGWAIFDGKNLIRYGVFEAKAEEEVNRFHEIKIWLLSMIENWQPDVIAIEGIQYQSNFGVTTFQTLARLQGIIMELCYELNIDCKICPTNTWRAHCGVKGQKRSDRKRSMQLLVKQWFDITISDDEADAIGIGKYIADTYSRQVEMIDWE
jgi:Holliday junction resolvasome RuvABC endonuclease subunit